VTRSCVLSYAQSHHGLGVSCQRPRDVLPGHQSATRYYLYSEESYATNGWAYPEYICLSNVIAPLPARSPIWPTLAPEGLVETRGEPARDVRAADLDQQAAGRIPPALSRPIEARKSGRRDDASAGALG
jgi:hypothetical protein